MLHVACVMVGNYCGRGAEYVERLHDMVRRNLPDGFPGRFVCFTDDPDSLKALVGVETERLPPGLSGWWNKLALFAPDAFPVGDRVLYFDLDTVITGPLDEIAAYDGPFAILRDVYRQQGLQSSVMAWKAGNLNNLWSNWTRADCSAVEGGDQAWIESQFSPEGRPPDLWQDLFPGRFRSYKVDCVWDVPAKTSVVFFHGHPRPHEVIDGWVPHLWKVGGGSTFEFVQVGTVPQNQVLANIKDALTKGYPVLETGDAITAAAVLCAGGPSLKDHLSLIHNLQRAGAAVFAVNQSDGFLREHEITPNFHVMLDAREDHAEWVNPGGIKLYASMSHPATLAAAARNGELTVWHAMTDGIETVLPAEPPSLIIGGGTTVGCRTLVLAHALGFRRLLCIGYDSSYREGAHHAYAQPLNDADRILDVLCGGRAFKAAPWMAQQAQDFCELVPQLLGMGTDISVFGDGLLPHKFGLIKLTPNAADERASTLLDWLKNIENPVGAEVGVFTGELSRRLLARPDLTLNLVDHWRTSGIDSAYAQSGDFHAKLTQAEQNHFMEQALAATHFARTRRQVLRAASIEAAAGFPDASLDFVFLDADHSYDGCRADILAWLPKVKPGGFISGHDYDHPEFPNFGVKRAVDELLGIPELGLNLTWRVRLEQAYVTRTA